MRWLLCKGERCENRCLHRARCPALLLLTSRPWRRALLHLQVVSLMPETSLRVHLAMLEQSLLPLAGTPAAPRLCAEGGKRGRSEARPAPLRAPDGRVSPLLGRSPSAGTTAAPPGRRGCCWISGTQTGRPRKGRWSDLFLPRINTRTRKSIRRVEAPPRKGECEKAGPKVLGPVFSGGGLSRAPDQRLSGCVVFA